MRLASISFATMVLIIGSAANAQLYRAQKPVVKTDTVSKPSEAEQVMEQFAKCLIKNPARQRVALEYLQLPDGDPEQGKRGAALTKRGCVPAGTAKMSFQPRLFRYSLYSAMYRKYFRKKEPIELGGKLKMDFSSEFNQVRSRVSNIELAIRSFGDCVARKNSKTSHRLLLAQVHSQSEKDTINQIMPDLGACLSDGVELKFSRTMIRGIIAEAMYKLRFASENGQLLEASN